MSYRTPWKLPASMSSVPVQAEEVGRDEVEEVDPSPLSDLACPRKGLARVPPFPQGVPLSLALLHSSAAPRKLWGVIGFVVVR